MPENRTQRIANRQELKQTLWKCRRCAALIAIHSAEAIESATCPICCDVALDHVGLLKPSWEWRYGNARLPPLE